MLHNMHHCCASRLLTFDEASGAWPRQQVGQSRRCKPGANDYLVRNRECQVSCVRLDIWLDILLLLLLVPLLLPLLAWLTFCWWCGHAFTPLNAMHRSTGESSFCLSTHRSQTISQAIRQWVSSLNNHMLCFATSHHISPWKPMHSRDM